MKLPIRREVTVHCRQANGVLGQRTYMPGGVSEAWIEDGAFYELDAVGELTFFIAAHHVVCIVVAGSQQRAPCEVGRAR